MAKKTFVLAATGETECPLDGKSYLKGVTERLAEDSSARRYSTERGQVQNEYRAERVQSKE
jgi:hypothetical protein